MNEINNSLGVVDGQKVALGVLVCILLLVIVGLIVVLVVKYIKRNKNQNKTNNDSSNINKQEELLKQKQALLDQKLSEVSGLSKDQAKQELMTNLESELSKYINEKIVLANDKIHNESMNIARQTIVEAMEDIAEQATISNTTYTIDLKNDNVKGHIIGKNGKNITAFKEITGVDVIIDKEPTITLSSLNPKKREIARLTMNKLLAKGIDPLTIKKVYEEQKNAFNQVIYDYGLDAVERKLKIYDLNKELYPYIGNLYFRTSFSQNVLSHSIEVARLCESIAKQLNLDPIKAKKIGLLHDIGKSIDYETDYDHVSQGIKIIKKYINDPDYINAIASHHDQVSCNNLYSWILKVADTISAGRPGARNTNMEEYLKRVEYMEKVCLEFPEVTEAHVYHAGRTLLVYVDPAKISDDNYEKLAYDIAKKLEESDLTNFYQIDITINRINTFNTKTTPKIK